MSTDLPGELERLSELHAKGSLNDEEYAAAKQRLLGGGTAPGTPPPPNIVYAVPPQPPARSGAGTVVAVLVGLGAVVLLLAVLSILAVTFLGKNASAKFSSVGSRVGVVAPAPEWLDHP